MPLVNLLHKNRVTPNQVTISACLLSILIGVLFYFNYESFWIYAVLPVFMFVRMAMKAIDGVLAQKFNLHRGLGKFLNELTDVISDTSLLIYTLGINFFTDSRNDFMVEMNESMDKLLKEGQFNDVRKN